MHDYNLKRLAGVNKKVQDMTYNELVGLPISQSGHTSKIPSFEEYVKRAKELNIKLVVELKPHGGEPNNYVDIFIEKVSPLIHYMSYLELFCLHQQDVLGCNHALL